MDGLSWRSDCGNDGLPLAREAVAISGHGRAVEYMLSTTVPSFSYKNVVVIGAVDSGENIVSPVHGPCFMHRACVSAVDGAAVLWPQLSFPRLPTRMAYDFHELPTEVISPIFS
jgi:hypothetical protein